MFVITVEPLIAATFSSKLQWPLWRGGRYKEVFFKNFYFSSLTFLCHSEYYGHYHNNFSGIKAIGRSRVKILFSFVLSIQLNHFGDIFRKIAKFYIFSVKSH